jgi:hypothetical protein
MAILDRISQPADLRGLTDDELTTLSSEIRDFIVNAVSETAHLCGRYSCTESLIAISQGGWPVMLSVGFISLVAPTLLVQVMRSLMSSSPRTDLPINNYHHAGKFL